MPWFVTLALFVASYVLQAIIAPKNKIAPATIDQFQFPQFDEGTPQGIIFGDAWTPGFVPWFGNLRTKKIRAGGKK